MDKRCSDHSGFKSDIHTLCKFKDETVLKIDKTWDLLEKKVGRGLLVTFAILIVGLFTSLYGLTYKTQSEILDKVNTIEVNVAVIKEQVKSFRGRP